MEGQPKNEVERRLSSVKMHQAGALTLRFSYQLPQFDVDLAPYGSELAGPENPGLVAESTGQPRRDAAE